MRHAGPIQYDAAVDPEIARQKVKQHSEVAGQANVCIFPDLNTGNNTYKVSHAMFFAAAAANYLTHGSCVTRGVYYWHESGIAELWAWVPVPSIEAPLEMQSQCIHSRA